MEEGQKNGGKQNGADAEKGLSKIFDLFLFL